MGERTNRGRSDQGESRVIGQRGRERERGGRERERGGGGGRL